MVDKVLIGKPKKELDEVLRKGTEIKGQMLHKTAA